MVADQIGFRNKIPIDLIAKRSGFSRSDDEDEHPGKPRLFLVRLGHYCRLTYSCQNSKSSPEEAKRTYTEGHEGQRDGGPTRRDRSNIAVARFLDMPRRIAQERVPTASNVGSRDVTWASQPTPVIPFGRYVGSHRAPASIVAACLGAVPAHPSATKASCRVMSCISRVQISRESAEFEVPLGT